MTTRGAVYGATVLLVLAAIAADANAADAVKPALREPMLLGAHRGGAGLWPENTVEGFKACAERWPEVLLEADARLTSDGRVVLQHDEKVDRTTDGTGVLGQMTFEAVRKLDAGFRFTPDDGKTFPYREKDVRVPTLEEALNALPKSRFLIELKDHEGIADAVMEAIRACDAEDRVIIASFIPAHMARLLEIAPNVATCYDFTRGTEMLKTLRAGDWSAYRPTADVLSLMKETVAQYKLTPDELKAIRDKGVIVQLHTLDDPQEIDDALDIGVDSILSDYPDRLAAAIEKRKAVDQSPN